MTFKDYLYQNYSDELINKTVKKAQKLGNVDPHRKLRTLTNVAVGGLGGILPGMKTQQAVNLINQIKNPNSNVGSIVDGSNIAGGVLGGLAGIGLGMGVSAIQNKLNRISIKRIFKNALNAGIITKKELDNYINTGKITPSIAKAMNSTTVGDNIRI